MPGRKHLTLVTLLWALFAFTFASAQDSPEPPIYVTSAGQALDAFTVHTLLERTGVESTYDSLAEPEDLDGFGTLVIAAGASLKGFGEAGITADSEVTRTEGLLTAAKEAGMFIIGVHIGGEERRGGLSEQFVDLVSEAADYLIVTEPGNSDGYFDEAAEEHDVPLVVIPQPLTVGEEIANLF